ncbi:kinase-like domain-containing protein [Obelidium mucronatum]|nr:kinase-like domain-containing protein [Obelidium mucronatum]
MLKWLGLNATVSAFEVGEQIGSGGAGLHWKVYSATKKSSQKSSSLFVYEKKDKETCDLLKRDVATLSRLRHPSLLEVSEPADDSKSVLSFASEPLIGCLANVLGNWSNVDKRQKQTLELDEIEIQKGLLQVIKGLEFLHQNKWIHACLSPESIFINAKGDWKIAAFTFAQSCSNSADGYSTFYLSNYPPFCSPSLDFLAPEAVLDSRVDSRSDIWSLGCLIYAIFNQGVSPLYTNDNLQSYRSKVGAVHLHVDVAKNVPSSLVEPLQRMIQKDPASRLSLAEFQTSAFFDNILVSTISFLEAFVEKNQISKAQFLKGLVKMLPQFSMKLVNRKILPALLNEIKDPLMTPFVLPNIFWISEHSTNEEFNARILPALKSVFKITDPPQAILLLLSRMDIFLKKVPSAEVFKQDVMPLVYSALDIPVPQVQEQAIKMIPSLLSKLDFTSTKSILFPKIQAIYLSTTSLSIRIACLITIHGMLKILDKFTIVEKLIPVLKQNKVREAGLLLAILAVYDEVSRHVDREVVAGEVLPEVWKMSVDQVLNVKQFKKFMKVIRELTDRIEEQHTKFLEEVKSMDTPSQSTAAEGGTTNTTDVSPKPDDFASLVRGSSSTNTAPMKSSSQNLSATSNMAKSNGFTDDWVEFDHQPATSNAIQTTRTSQSNTSNNFANWGAATSSVSAVSAVKPSTTVNMGMQESLIPTLVGPPAPQHQIHHKPSLQHFGNMSSLPPQHSSISVMSGGTTAFPNAGVGGTPDLFTNGSGWNAANSMVQQHTQAAVQQPTMVPLGVNAAQFHGSNAVNGSERGGSSTTQKRNQRLNEFDPFG